MIGIDRKGQDECTLVLGHQEIHGDLHLAWDVGAAIDKCTRGRPLLNKPGPAVCALIPGRKMAVEFDGVRLWFHNHEGTAPTHWHTTCVPEEIAAWTAYFHFLVGIDNWSKETIPAARAHLIPMKWAAFRQHPGPYRPAWQLLKHVGYAPAASKIPTEEPFDEIVKRCSTSGLRMKRLHLIEA